MKEDLFFVYFLKAKNKFIYCDQPVIANIYYKDHYIDLITGERIDLDYSNIINKLQEIKVSSNHQKHHIFILYYEFGHIINETKINVKGPIAIELKFQNSKSIGPFEINSEKLIQSHSSLEKIEEYGNKFDQVQNHLMAGDCYQINLTLNECRDFIGDKQQLMNRFYGLYKNLSPYAHMFYIPSLGHLIISNSPECLFQKKINADSSIDLYTMPIKGTNKIQECSQSAWIELLNSKKDRAELFMISDLMRNDLSRIENATARIVTKRGKLIVPQLVHQYSLIANKISSNVNLSKIIHSLFPGGSITGAPKKRVMQLISQIEKRERGIYCGSTMILFKKNISTSINIRTAVFDMKSKKVNYGTGGGVTIKSQKYDEYNEILHKSASFFNFFNNQITDI